MLKNKKGFTLIELLVVVAIIGILSSVVLTSLTSVKSKGRNTQRVQMAKQLANAFNLGLDSNNNNFPSTSGNWACVSATCYGAWNIWGASGAIDTYLSPYITKPTDPTDSTRGAGGIGYNSAYSGATSSYDSYVFPAGVYLIFATELPAGNTSCGNGHIIGVSTRVECLLKLN